MKSVWTQRIDNGMFTNPDPLTGGIVDRNFVSNEWFVIPHADFSIEETFKTSDEAFAALDKELRDRGYI